MTVILITGGARSGKSLHAETLALAHPGRPVYIATAEARDAEMAARIAAHRARRAARWRDVEAPLDLGPAIEGAAIAAAGGDMPGATPSAGADGDVAGGAGAILVDCLTLWLSNLMHAGRDWRAEGEALAAVLARAPGPVILVTNEVGMGIVPDNALARAFRDAAGWMNQRMAAAADEVIFTVAGLPMKVK